MDDGDLLTAMDGQSWLRFHPSDLRERAAIELMERQLIAGLADLANRNSAGDIIAYAGWTSGKLPRHLFGALSKALPFPHTLQHALEERRKWLWLVQSRRANGRRLYRQPLHIKARLAALAVVLSRKPDPTVEGIRARFNWLAHSVEGGLINVHEILVMTANLNRDFDAFVSELSSLEAEECGEERRVARRVQRSNADKHSSVLRMLEGEPRLSDREVARRCGVSPPMVGSWRRRRGA